MSKCECTMSISVLGDGCRYCQPQDQIDRLADALAEETAKADHAEELAKALEWLLFSCTSVSEQRITTPKASACEMANKALTNYRESTKCT